MKFSIAATFLSASMVCGEFDFLLNYNLKVVACQAENRYVCGSCNETGIAQSNVIYRLCPTSGECSDDVGKSCTAGYGDYLMGINTFVQEYLQQKHEEIVQNDDSFQLDQLGECRQYKADPDGAYADREFYVGPACTADGTGVRVALFSDKDCYTEEETATFEEISAGMSLPYSKGGLVAQHCESCYSANDNSDAGLNDLCRNVYEASEIKCETKMEIFHLSGRDESNCELIDSNLLKEQEMRNWVQVFGWLLFTMVVCGLVGFVFTAMKKNQKKGNMNYSLLSYELELLETREPTIFER
jgi:hypothetical protein